MKISNILLASISVASLACACGEGPGGDPGASNTEALSYPTGAITDDTGLCVDVRSAATSDGTIVQVYSCNGTTAQKWTLTNGSLVGIAGKCLDVQWGASANGTPVQLWDCNGTAAQKWQFANGQLIGIAGKCLDVPNSNSVSGQHLQIWDCWGGKNQQFSFNGTTAGTDAGAPVADSATPPPPTSGGTGITAARAFMANLTLGIQIPRGQQSVLTYNGVKLYESPEFFDYLKGLGITHVGFSYPWTPAGSGGGDLSFIGSPSVTDSYFTSLLAAAKLATKAGLKVAMRLTDNLQIPKDFGSTLDGWLTTAGKAVAGSGLDPAMILVLPWGEMVGSTNAACNPLASHGDQVLRAALPRAGGWLLGVSGAYWASSTVFNGDSSGEGRALVTQEDGEVDDQVVYVWDDYPFYDQGLQKSESGFAADIAKWQAAHGSAPVLNLETGDWHGNYDTNPGNPGAWASSYLPIAQGVGQYAAMLWDLSNSDGQANQASLTSGTEATLSTANANGLKAACAYVAAQSYQGNGAIR